jgi:lysophospholipase L1-like esterase
MNRWSVKVRLIVALLVITGALQAIGYAQSARPRRIAGFGSSVANGTGDEYNKEGYTGMLREMLTARGWEVVNVSRGGDMTKTLAARWSPAGTPDPRTRYLTPVNPGYVIIALSLANEGIFEAATPAEKDAVFQQYADGIKALVTKARQQNIAPVVTLCYPRSVYTPVEYGYIKRMNILLNSWDVPTVNVLGSTEDGSGHFAKGFMFNDKHPNASGHREMMLSFVPTLFDALEKDKPTPSIPLGQRGFARISGGAAPLTFTADSTIHSFAVSLMVRSPGDGTVIALGGSTLAARTEAKTSGTDRFDEVTMVADRPFTATVAMQNGTWTYMPSDGPAIASASAADGQWHHIVISHSAARGMTFLFVDGKLAGSTAERLEPNRIVVGGPGSAQGSAPKQADYKDVFVFRSALNADEVAVLHSGRMLQASLEVYAPLNDTQFKADAGVENRAQSLAVLKVGAGRIMHADDGVKATK